jgi:hypothetical protein
VARQAKAKAKAPKPVKPFKQLAPSQQKRVRSYAAKHGITIRQARSAAHRQAARGHKPPSGKTEAQVRREKEQRKQEMLGALTTPQRTQVRAFFNANMAPREARAGVSPSTVGAQAIAASRESFVGKVTAKGFAWFQDLRTMRDRTQSGDYGYDMAAWEDYLDTDWDLDEWHLWYQ